MSYAQLAGGKKGGGAAGAAGGSPGPALSATVDRNKQRAEDWLARELAKLWGARSDDGVAAQVLALTSWADIAAELESLCGASAATSALLRELETRVLTFERPPAGAGAGAAGAKGAKARNTNATAAQKTAPLQKDADTFQGAAPSDFHTGKKGGAAGAAGGGAAGGSAANRQRSRSPQMSESDQSAYDSAQAAKEAARLKETGGKVKVKYVKDKRTGKSSAHVREACYCNGLTHGCFTNCTACGRIACQLEGEGPCFFCNTPVLKAPAAVDVDPDFVQLMTRQVAAANAAAKRGGGNSAAAAAAAAAEEPLVVVDAADEKSAPAAGAGAGGDSVTGPAPVAAVKKREATAEEKAEAERVAAGLKKAVAHKDKLLSYARDQAVRSLMVDDQADYFDMQNQWLSGDEKQIAQRKAAEEKAKIEALEKRSGARVVTLDIAGRQVVNEREKNIFEQHLDHMRKGGLSLMHADAANIYDDAPAPQKIRDGDRELPFSQNEYDEIKGGLTDTKYFANDTLHGRAKRVYDDLKERLRKEREEKQKKKAQEQQKGKGGGGAAPGPNEAGFDAKQRMPNERQFYRLQHDPSADSDNPFAGITESEFVAATDQDGFCSTDPTAGVPKPKRSKEAAAAAAAIGLGGPEADGEPSAYDDKSDKGVCLSMHQPWASLLVYGIKRFEGRGWSTPHRGRLWIASTVHEATAEEVEELEREYRMVYGSEAKIPFPQVYPASALLGCVDLVDCVPNEAFAKFKAAHPHEPIESSDSPHLFVCTHPRVLRLPQRVSGQHKLWDLDKALLAKVQSGLKPIPIGWRLGLSAFKKSPALDLWPQDYKGDANAGAAAAAGAGAGAADKVRAVPKRLRPGMLHIPNFLSVAEQQELVDICRGLGMGKGGFYHPSYKGSVHQHLRMYCMGKHWNLQTSKYTPTRTDYDNAAVPDIPPRLVQIVTRVMDACRAHLASAGYNAATGASLRVDVDGELPPVRPDICLVNFYQPATGKLGFHRDKDESEASLKGGIPVVSLSVGDSADFAYSDQRPTALDESLGMTSQSGAPAGCEVVRLNSGDALVFGGPSRHVYHGVTRVHPNTAPRGLKMRAGRLNLTFRQY